MSRKISAIIFDLDGTAIPNRMDGMPSTRLIDVVQQAKEQVKVACASGRQLVIAQPIVESLQLSSPCILGGGSTIVDPITFQPIWEKKISVEQLTRIIESCRHFPYIIGDNQYDAPLSEYQITKAVNILYVMNVPAEKSAEVVEALQQEADVSALPVKGWTPGFVDIHISHRFANKRFALEKWLEIERIDPDEVMVAGDSQNDLPLFEVGGFKVAMGDGVQLLKDQADWVAPPQEHDGLAVAIEKFILNK